MWLEDLRCHGDKDVARARAERTETDEKRSCEAMLKNFSTPVTTPTVLEHCYLSKLYFPEKTSMVLLRGKVKQTATTVTFQSPPDAYTLTRTALSGKVDEPTVCGNKDPEKKKRRRNNKKQRARLSKQKQKQKANQAKDSEALD